MVLGPPRLLGQDRQRPALEPDRELPLDLRARLGHLARARRHHLAQPGRDAPHLEVAPPVTGARPDRPPGVDERVGDLGAKQRAALQRGVVAKPLPRVGRHQPPIHAHHADHEVVHMQLRRRRPIAARPPRGHMQRGRDRRPRRRLPHPHPVLPAAVNDRLVAHHVLNRALRRNQESILDPLAISLIGHRPQHRNRLRHRHRHLDVRDTAHPLDHATAIVVEERPAALVARLALERARATQLLPAVDMLPLERGDQIVALDRLAAPHPELNQRGVGAQPQRRRPPLRAALETLLGELVVTAGERLRRRLELKAVVTGPRGVGAVADLDHDLRQRQHQRASSSGNGLTGGSVASYPDAVRLVWCD